MTKHETCVCTQCKDEAREAIRVAEMKAAGKWWWPMRSGQSLPVSDDPDVDKCRRFIAASADAEIARRGHYELVKALALAIRAAGTGEGDTSAVRALTERLAEDRAALNRELEKARQEFKDFIDSSGEGYRYFSSLS